MAQTIQQRRAAFALEGVKQAASNSRVNKKEYKSYAASLPAMIHMNGLGQAAAFYLSKGGMYKELYQLVSDWLTKDGQPFSKHGDLLEGITAEDMHRYRLAEAEALALMDWVKKFANAYMEEKS